MSITPFKKVTSREIYGADISALQDAINKLETILAMHTASVTGHVLQETSDQPEAAMHRRIYEGTVRNWLESPAPVIRRGGVVVPVGEYALFAAQGMVVFHAQQPVGTAITADFTHIHSSSPLSGHVGAGAGVHAAATAAVAGFMPAGDKARLDALDYLRYRRRGRYHCGITAGELVTAAVTVDTMDIIPFYVPVTQTFDRIAVAVTVAGAAGTRVRLGLYADTGEVYPGALVLDAGEVTVDVLGERFLAISLTLTAGLYWTANLFNGTPTIRVVPSTALMALGWDTTSTSIDTGFRITQPYGPLPNPAPTAMPTLLAGRRAVLVRRA